MRRIGLLTAGGDCPGLNAVIRGVVAGAVQRHGAEVVGILDGWDGLMDGRVRRLDRDAVRGILQRGGTILGTSRRDPYVHGEGAASLRETMSREWIDSLVVVGGDGTLRTALRLAEEGVQLVGVPKTIDNDIAGTDVTFGFDTAVQIATDAIDRITTTAESHDRIMVVEVMGRTRGWIATYAGIAAGADVVLVPEEPYDLEKVASLVRARAERGRRYSVVVVAEGIAPPPGTEMAKPVDVFGFERLGGVSSLVAAARRDDGVRDTCDRPGSAVDLTPPTDSRSRLGVAAADLVASKGSADGRVRGGRSSTCHSRRRATRREVPADPGRRTHAVGP
jgi:6-phosphofructokinase 1